MKKTILFFIAILFGTSVYSQLVGDGLSPATAYCGTITSAQSWTNSNPGGIIYVGQPSNQDLTILTGGSLTIGPGVTLKFCTTTTDLIITGTGTITANGTSSNKITFTRNNPSINYWGHITFQSMGSAGASLFNNCIIEYGDVTRNPGITSYGGGLYADFNNVNISNCIFQNNRAGWGGGIFVNHNISITVTNSRFFNNYSKEAGGGIFVYYQSSSIFNNCIFDSNHCDGTSSASYNGGGFSEISSSSVTLNNCTFVNNTSSRTVGQSLQFYSSAGDKAVNCIFWGPGTHLYLSGHPIVNYCAVQSSVPPGTGNIILSANNTDPTGPNFKNPAGSDYSLTYLSPCRNAGTAIGVPTTDYLGNTRVLPYDIGAYEFIASLWKTTAATTDWTSAANWDGGVPSAGIDVIIPSGAVNYPVNTPAPTFTLSAGNNMILAPGAKATLGTFINNGSLTLQSDATSGSASFIVSSYSGNDATIELFLTGGNPGAPLKLNKWHFISTPITSLPVSTFSPVPTKNVVGWYDNQVSGSLATGWIAYNGFRYSTGTISGPTFSNLTPGNGYDYYATTDLKYTFSGQLNTTDVTMSLSYNVDDALHGFNLLGNPFSSGLNWDAIINNLSPAYPANTSKSLYFTRDNAQCSYVGGVGIPSDVTGIMPPMQGFFVKTFSAGNSITIPASARVQGNIHSRYKGVDVIPLVRLSLAEDTLHDETVVRFDATAKSGFDYDFDAPKMFLSPDLVSIYSISEGLNYAIKGLPFPDSLLEVPIVVNLLAAGNTTITATQLQGLDKYDVTLTDKTTGFIANLKTTPVLTFTGTAGTTATRFVLKVATITTGIENPVVSKNIFKIYDANSMINIQTISDAWEGKKGSVRVLDLTGRTVDDLKNSEFSKNSLIRIGSPGLKGIYFVEIKSGVLRYVGKVVIR